MQLPVRCPCPAVATVHDLAFLDFGEHFTWWRRMLSRLQARQVLRTAAHLAADSEATRRGLERHYGVPAEGVTVAWAGCSDRFRLPVSGEVIRAVRERHGLPERYVLYVGRLQPRTNIVRLVEAFAQMRSGRPELPQHLVLAGGKGWLDEEIYAAAKRYGVDAYVHFTGFFPEEDLPALYAGADVLALVSLWEGFGLPVAEAMACGTAVLCSDCSSLPEVAGDAAVLVDPMDMDAIAVALARLLIDDAYRARFEESGPAQAALFRWEATAAKLMDAFQKAAGS